MIAVTALLLSLAVVVSAGPFIENGERWEGLGILWWFSIPAMVVCGVVSAFVYRWYRTPTGSVQWALRFVVVGACVAGCGMLLTWLCLAWVY